MTKEKVVNEDMKMKIDWIKIAAVGILGMVIYGIPVLILFFAVSIPYIVGLLLVMPMVVFIFMFIVGIFEDTNKED